MNKLMKKLSTLEGLRAKLKEAEAKGNKKEIALYRKAIKTQEFWS